jgi:phosphonate transport system permease protein
MPHVGARRAVLAGIVLAGIGAAVYLRLDPARLVEPGTASIVARFFAAALSPALVAEEGSGVLLLPKVLEAVRTTVAFAAAGMTLALGLGVVLGFLASSAWWEGDPVGARSPVVAALRRVVAPAVTALARVLIAAMRSVHELLWAMLFLAALGLSPATAVVAIALPYGGTLAKVFSEMIDEAPRDAARALRGLGAGPIAVWAVGLLPRALADMGSYSFYRFECALRSSAVLGFFGFPTLGYYVSLSFENLHYREVWTYLYALFALILVVELWSGALRRREGWA